MSEAKLNWSTAKVDDSALRVDLDGEIPSGWKERFDTVARLLAGSSDWGEVSLKKNRVLTRMWMKWLLLLKKQD